MSVSRRSRRCSVQATTACSPGRSAKRRRPAASACSSFCECGRRRCRDHVHLTIDEYEAVRADPRRFIVVPGHELLAAETVVERHDQYFVVEKPEEVRALVERMDLRRDGPDDP